MQLCEHSWLTAVGCCRMLYIATRMWTTILLVSSKPLHCIYVRGPPRAGRTLHVCVCLISPQYVLAVSTNKLQSTSAARSLQLIPALIPLVQIILPFLHSTLWKCHVNICFQHIISFFQIFWQQPPISWYPSTIDISRFTPINHF